MSRLWRVATVAAAASLVAPQAAAVQSCQYRSPQAYAEAIGTSAYTLLVDGDVVDSFGDLSRNHRLHSIRKSIMSVLVGIAVSRGKLQLDARLSDIGIDDYVELSDQERQAMLRHLLQSRSGVYRQATHENRGFDKVRPPRESHRPGSHWFYSNWDFNSVGSIYQIETGRSVCRALHDDLARPLGMRDFKVENCGWRYSARSRHPAYVFRMSARDLASFGELMRNEGHWSGKPIIPRQWVTRSTSPVSVATRPNGSPLPGSAYGLMWWTSFDGKALFHGMADPPDLGTSAFVASGTGSQFLVVAPARRLVFVHLADTERPAVSDISPLHVGCLLKLLINKRSAAPQNAK